jgi:hypothetical protein
MKLFSIMKDGINSIVSSPQKLQGDDSDAATTEMFRRLMLELAQTMPGEKAARLALRIQCAATLQSLWFMRSDVMALLAPACGEEEARHRLEVVSAPVREALPEGLRSRPSPLNKPR